MSYSRTCDGCQKTLPTSDTDGWLQIAVHGEGGDIDKEGPVAHACSARCLASIACTAEDLFPGVAVGDTDEA